MSNLNLNPSKLDRLTGKHTVSLIIALLFIITLFAFVVMSWLNKELTPGVNNLLSSLLARLTGVLSGNNFRK